MTDPALARLRLYQLISPTLPIGAFAYSQGLESAVEAGWVHDRASAEHWLQGCLLQGLARVDLPWLLRLHQAWRRGDAAATAAAADELLAWRETAELRAEERQLGQALARLLYSLDVEAAAPWQTGGVQAGRATLAGMLALAAVHWGMAAGLIAEAYAWMWLENQVAAAVKLIPLGQTDGQRLLASLATGLPALTAQAATLRDADIGAGLPGLALASALHETQYSRLFRS